MRRRALAGALTLAALLAPAASAVASSPQLRKARFSAPAVAGQVASLELLAADADVGMTGVVAAFEGEGVYGTSACRLRARSAGAERTLTVPHRFAATGPRPVVVRLDAGTCTRIGGSTLQLLSATPVNAGEATVEPAIIGPPIEFLATRPGTPDPRGPSVDPPAEPSRPQVPPGSEPKPKDGGGVVARAASGCPGADDLPAPGNVARIRSATLCLVNAVRRAGGLRPLRRDRRLSRAAAIHSRDMILRGYFSHVAPGGATLVNRLRRARWLPRRPGWLAGENIGFGEHPLSTPRATVDGWLASSAHRENMLDRTWRLAGAGIVPGIPASVTGGATYTAVFGR